MNSPTEDSGATGIMIAVLIGGLLLVAVGTVAFLFLGTASSTSSDAPASSSSSAPALLEEPAANPALDAELEGVPEEPEAE